MNDARAVYEALLAGTGAGADDGSAADRTPALVLATVVATRGSVPRRAGSRMAIDVARNILVGTIGGGCGEADVLEAAPEIARSGTPRLLRIELTDPVDSWSPAVCGGVMEVLVEPVFAADRPDASRPAASPVVHSP